MSELKEIKIPNIGDFDAVDVIEVLVKPGDIVHVDDSLITLESDKASMEIPAPEEGRVHEVKIKVGDRVSEGSSILVLESLSTSDEGIDPGKKPNALPEKDISNPLENSSEPLSSPTVLEAEQPRKESSINSNTIQSPAQKLSPTAHFNDVNFRKAHASPSIRRFARELGVDLSRVHGSGSKGRILREDVQEYVKKALTQTFDGGLGVAPFPDVDFSEFGEVDYQPLTKINKLTGKNLHRNWISLPHVTQFDEADITELEMFRKQMVSEYQKDGIKITLLSFLMKAVVSALRAYPRFNSSLAPDGEQLVLKHYYHIGIAVDTDDGLVVPVIKDVDRKSLVDLATELQDVSQRARSKKLKPSDMQGGCISISSLGGIGGTAFTPIINAPEVAILGVSRAKWQPVWKDGEFIPRLMLPLSLSYDHRVIDGALGARFTSFLSKLLSDTRRMLL